MKLDSEPLYDNSDRAPKVTSDCNKQFPSDILKFDDRDGETEQVVMLDLSQSYNDSGNSYHINNCMRESDSRATPIAREDLFYMDKTITDVKLPDLSVVSIKASPAVKDICIDEGAQMFDKILVEFDQIDRAVFSSSKFPRVNGNSARGNEKSDDLKPLSTNEGLGLSSSGEISERVVGDTEFSSTTCLNETMETTAENDLRSFLVAGYPAEHCYCSSSIGERKPLDTTEITAWPPPREERSRFLEESSTGFPRFGSPSHNDGASENQDPRPKVDQISEEEKDLAAMAASSPEKAKESNLIAGTVSSNKDLLEQDETSEFVAASNDANGASASASASDLEAGDTSMGGNEGKAVVVPPSQNGGEAEEAASDGAASARSSFSHLSHGNSNLLEPAAFSGSITSSHMPYSGNISLRSESSTTSGQSFAFPVLQPEWSNSPVRMAKAERRHLRRHRWMNALTCCKF